MIDSGYDNPNSPRIERQRGISPLEIEERSKPSDKHPEENQDATLVSELGNGFTVASVFDGVGGLKSGSLASSLARESMYKKLSESLHLGMASQQVEDLIYDSLIETSEEIRKQAKDKGIGEMATTASVVLIQETTDGKRKLYIGNVGDSRVYLRRNEHLHQLTIDDNPCYSGLSEEQAKKLQSKFANTVDPQKDLTPNEQTAFKKRNIISQGLGLDIPEPNICTLDFLPEDLLVICSDGISDNLTDKEIASILNNILGKFKGNYGSAISDLMRASRNRSRSNHPRAKADDITAILIGENFTGVSRTPTISGSKTLAELVSAIEQNRGLQGSKRFFPAEELIEIIDGVIRGKNDIRDLTRTGGLREKVQEIIR